MVWYVMVYDIYVNGKFRVQLCSAPIQLSLPSLNNAQQLLHVSLSLSLSVSLATFAPFSRFCFRLRVVSFLRRAVTINSFQFLRAKFSEISRLDVSVGLGTGW